MLKKIKIFFLGTFQGNFLIVEIKLLYFNVLISKVKSLPLRHI